MDQFRFSIPPILCKKIGCRMLINFDSEKWQLHLASPSKLPQLWYILRMWQAAVAEKLWYFPASGHVQEAAAIAIDFRRHAERWCWDRDLFLCVLSGTMAIAFYFRWLQHTGSLDCCWVLILFICLLLHNNNYFGYLLVLLLIITCLNLSSCKILPSWKRWDHTLRLNLATFFLVPTWQNKI